MTDKSKLAEFKALSKKVTDDRHKLAKMIEKDGPSLIAKAFQEVLVDCPDVVVFWRQGTPSFNDGAPCRFRVHDMWICPEDSDYGEVSAIDCDTGKRPADSNDDDDDYDRVYATAEQQEKLYEVWNMFDSFVLENSFGEAKVTISADSVEVEEFDWYD